MPCMGLRRTSSGNDGDSVTAMRMTNDIRDRLSSSFWFSPLMLLGALTLLLLLLLSLPTSLLLLLLSTVNAVGTRLLLLDCKLDRISMGMGIGGNGSSTGAVWLSCLRLVLRGSLILHWGTRRTVRLSTAPDLLCVDLPLVADLLGAADLSIANVLGTVFASRSFRSRSLRRGDMAL